MFCHRNALIFAVFQLMCFVSFSEAYPNGSLEEACYTMAPVHGDATPSTSPCLYETVPDVVSIDIYFLNNAIACLFSSTLFAADNTSRRQSHPNFTEYLHLFF